MFRLIILIFCCLIFVFQSNEQVNNGSKNCVCVPHYLCNQNGFVNTDGSTFIDVRAVGGKCGPQKICCKKNSTIQETNVLPVASSKCGYQNIDSVEIFKNETEASDTKNEPKFGEIPWTVVVLQKNITYDIICGGSLIHPQVVLTAAHCVNASGSFRVRAGKWNKSENNSILSPPDKNVTNVIVHPSFNPYNLHKDIALLLLESPLIPMKHINVPCLPPKKHEELSDECFMTKWDINDFDFDSKKVQLKRVRRLECQHLLRQTPLNPYFELDRSFICASGTENNDACVYDGGNPLMCPIKGEKNRYQQVGIVSWGLECGKPDQPGLYTNVAYFRQWIDDEMKKRNFDISSYII